MITNKLQDAVLFCHSNTKKKKLADLQAAPQLVKVVERQLIIHKHGDGDRVNVATEMPPNSIYNIIRTQVQLLYMFSVLPITVAVTFIWGTCLSDQTWRYSREFRRVAKGSLRCAGGCKKAAKEAQYKSSGGSPTSCVLLYLTSLQIYSNSTNFIL